MRFIGTGSALVVLCGLFAVSLQKTIPSAEYEHEDEDEVPHAATQTYAPSGISTTLAEAETEEGTTTEETEETEEPEETVTTEEPDDATEEQSAYTTSYAGYDYPFIQTYDDVPEKQADAGSLSILTATALAVLMLTMVLLYDL